MVRAGTAFFATAPGAALAQTSTNTINGWEEEYAYTLGVQAYIYCYPWQNMAYRRWLEVAQPPPSNEARPYAPLNQFWNAINLMDATSRNGGTPNTDTLYSSAWLDLTSEPVILSVPRMDRPDRYYTFELSSMDSDNFGYVGIRTTGVNGGNYAILGPNWHGVLPQGVTAVVGANELRSRTPYVLVGGRTLVFGTNDLPNVHELQAQYKLTPLSYWGTTNAPPANTNVWPPFATDNNPLADWETINRAMTENPPNDSSQQALIDLFASIGVGPGQDVTRMDPSTQAGLILAAPDAFTLMMNEIASGAGTLRVNGWEYQPPDIGRTGQYNDFLTRACLQSYLGIIANDPVEAVYLDTYTDADDNPLSGTNNYTMTFAPGGLPEVGAFWSVTLYDSSNNLVANELNRYKLGSLSEPRLATDTNGGTTLYIQSTAATNLESNWLPAPTGAFHLVMRCYMPGAAIVNQTWAPPPIVNVTSAQSYTVHIEVVQDEVNLTWKASPGLQFQVRYATAIPSCGTIGWTTLPGTVTSADGNYSLVEAHDASAQGRFYQVLRLPLTGRSSDACHLPPGSTLGAYRSRDAINSHEKTQLK